MPPVSTRAARRDAFLPIEDPFTASPWRPSPRRPLPLDESQGRAAPRAGRAIPSPGDRAATRIAPRSLPAPRTPVAPARRYSSALPARPGARATGSARARPGAPRSIRGPRCREAAKGVTPEPILRQREGVPHDRKTADDDPPRSSTPARGPDAAPPRSRACCGRSPARSRRPARGVGGRPGASPPPPARRSGREAPPGGGGPGRPPLDAAVLQLGSVS